MEQTNPATAPQKRPGLSEIFGSGLVILGILTFFAVVSHQYNMANGSTDATNLIGAFGHYTAGYLTFLFGNGGLFLGPYLVLMGLMGIYRGAMEDPVPRVAALPFLLVSLSMILSLFFNQSDGGIVGQAVASGLSFAFGGFGTGVLAAGAFITAIIISLRLPVPILVKNIQQSIGGILPKGLFRSTGDYYVEKNEAAENEKEGNRKGDGIDLSALDNLAEKEKEWQQEKSYQVAPGVTINIGGGTGMAHQEESTANRPFFAKAQEEEGKKRPWFEKKILDEEQALDSNPHPPQEQAPDSDPPPAQRQESWAEEEFAGNQNEQAFDHSPGEQTAQARNLHFAGELSERIRNLQFTLSQIADKKKQENLQEQLSLLEHLRKKEESDDRFSIRTREQEPVQRQAQGQNTRPFSVSYAQVNAVPTHGERPGDLAFDGSFNSDESRFHFRNRFVHPRPDSQNAATGEAERRLLRTIDVTLLESKTRRISQTIGPVHEFDEPEMVQFHRPSAHFDPQQEMHSDAIDEDNYEDQIELQIEEDEPVTYEEAYVDPLDERAADGFPDESAPGIAENNEPGAEDGYEQGIESEVNQEVADRAASGGTPSTSARPIFSEVPSIRMTGGRYRLPPEILLLPEKSPQEDLDREIAHTRQKLEDVMKDYGIQARVVRTQRGPIITLYEIKLEPGTRVNKILGIYDEIKMNLEAASLRIVAPIPGKSTIGIEIPNRIRDAVALGEIIRLDRNFFSNQRDLGIVLGKDISGANQYVELTRLPHLLIAGATGAGKSVYMNSVIASLLYQRSPEELRFIMIDPKMVELKLYEGIPHLIMPVITDVKAAGRALSWVVQEMERRYAILSKSRSREIKSYNERVSQSELFGDEQIESRKMPYLVVVIDELADLMMVAAKEVEDSIIRLTQKARAVGIHIIMATQRPSVDVITALIKANCPARISFHVAQKTDSRTILDANGAETLLGKGDMLYKSPTDTATTRIQAPLITEEEIEKIVRETRRYGEPAYVDLPLEETEEGSDDGNSNDDGELFDRAWNIVQETGKTSTSYIQRRLRIGYNRAANLIEEMEERGYLSPAVGNRPREILKRS